MRSFNEGKSSGYIKETDELVGKKQPKSAFKSIEFQNEEKVPMMREKAARGAVRTTLRESQQLSINFNEGKSSLGLILNILPD